MSNKTYTDLEQEARQENYDSIRMRIIEMLIHQYPNDTDLGAKVREFIKLQENSNDF